MLRKTRCLLQFNNIVTLFFDFITNNQKELSIDAGIFNGSNLDNQKNAWFSSPAYSARLQYFPIYGLAIIPSVQHQLMAGREASYTSFDFGVYYEWNGMDSFLKPNTYANSMQRMRSTTAMRSIQWPSTNRN